MSVIFAFLTTHSVGIGLAVSGLIA